MQWRRKRRVLCVIGSANHALLVRHITLILPYSDGGGLLTGTDEESGLSLEPAPPSTDSSRITFNEEVEQVLCPTYKKLLRAVSRLRCSAAISDAAGIIA
ncbi:hypothetical protein J6590_009796 [Homalodisca vitripennis]|nr:hypothetical protein J6590_009796 [Homalodisca vitripennis]